MGTVKNISILFIKQFLLTVLFIILCTSFVNAAPIKYSDSLNVVRLRVIKIGTSDSVDAILRWGPGGICTSPTDTIDSNCDAIYMGKSGIDLASVDLLGQLYTINNGSTLLDSSIERRTVALSIFNLIANTNYQFKLKVESALKGKNKVYLYDQFTDTYTQIDNGTDLVTHTNIYSFSTTADAASLSQNRFYLVFNMSNTRIWRGKTSNNWTTNTNWYPISIPGSNADIVVDTTSNKLLLDQNRTIKNLTINNGAMIKLNGFTLTVQGTLSGTGTISSTPASSISILGSGTLGTIYFDQTTAGTTNVVNNFTLNRTSSGTATLGNAVTINGILTIATASSLQINDNTLTLAGTIAGTGTLAGSASSNLIINGTGSLGNLYFNQLKPDTSNVINNLTLNRTSTGTASIANKLILLGTFTPTAGVLNTTDSLVLRSTATNDAGIAIGNSSGGYINGKVSVERYVGNSAQWRMIGFPFLQTGSISGSALNNFYAANFYAYTYNEAADDGRYGNSGISNAGWVTLDLAATTSPNKGIIIIGGASNTIKLSATINTGTQTIPLSYTTGNSNKGWNLVSNPFPSNIDWDAIKAANPSANISSAIYRWDPVSLGYATYVNGFSTGNQSNIIENGASFFIKSTGATSISITEACKTTVAPAGRLFNTPNTNNNNTIQNFTINNQGESILQMSLKQQGDVVADEVIIRWSKANGVTDTFDDQYDALDFGRKAGPDLGIIDAKNELYAIYHGTELKQSIDENRSLQLQTSGLKAGATYELKTTILSSLAYNNQAYILDQYTAKYTPIDKETIYQFSVNNDSISASEKRLKLVFNQPIFGNAVDASTSLNKGFSLVGNPIKNNILQLKALSNYRRVEWQIIDNSGRRIAVGNLNNTIASQMYRIHTNTAASINGWYMLQLIADGKAMPALKFIQ